MVLTLHLSSRRLFRLVRILFDPKIIMSGLKATERERENLVKISNLAVVVVVVTHRNDKILPCH